MAITQTGQWVGRYAQEAPQTMITDGTYLYIALSSTLPTIIKVDPTTWETVGQVPGWEFGARTFNNSEHACIAHDGTYLYAILIYSSPFNQVNTYVFKIDPSTMEVLSYWDMGAKYQVVGICTGGGYVFATSVAYGYKIDPSTMTTAGTFTPDSSDAHNGLYYGGTLYIANGGSQLYTVDPSSMTKISISTAQSNSSGGTSLATDGTYVYMGTQSGNYTAGYSVALKFDMSGNYVARINQVANDYQQTGPIAVWSGYLYVTGVQYYSPTSPASIMKIDTASMAESTRYTYTTGTSWTYFGLTQLGSYLYGAYQNGSGTQPLYISYFDANLDAPTVHAGDPTSSDEGGYQMDSDGTYLYIGLGSGGCVQVDPTTMKTVKQYTAISVLPYVCCLGGYVYALNYSSSPGILLKLDPSTMTEVSRWTGTSSQTYADGLCTDGTYLYVLIPNSPSVVVKIDPATMSTLSPVWTGASGENAGDFLCSDGTYVYAAQTTSPGIVDKIDTSTMTTAGVWTGASGEDYVQSIFASGGYVYAAMYDSPYSIIQIDTATMATVLEFTPSSTEEFAYASTISTGTVYLLSSAYPGLVLSLTAPVGDLYAGYYYDPTYSYGYIVEIDPTTMAQVDTFTSTSPAYVNFVFSLQATPPVPPAGIMRQQSRSVCTLLGNSQVSRGYATP